MGGTGNSIKYYNSSSQVVQVVQVSVITTLSILRIVILAIIQRLNNLVKYKYYSLNGLTNYYFTNTLSTNDYTSTNTNHHVVNHEIPPGYTKLNDLIDYKYYRHSTNTFSLIKDSQNNTGYSNFLQTSTPITNYYFTNTNHY